MTATISGDGTSTLINLTTSGNTVLGDASTDTLNVGNGGLVKDASGNVGIGTSSPVARLNVSVADSGNIVISNTNDGHTGGLAFGDTSSNSSGRISYDHSSNAMRFDTAAAERMRIDSSGNLLVGTTTSLGSCLTTKNSSGSTPVHAVQHYSSAAAVWYMLRFFNGAGSGGGAITLNTSTLATAYTTSSDYRLKHDIAPMTGALERVAALKPVTYKWNADDSDGEGFIAHELQEVVPDAVTGEKDAVDAEGNPQYQGVDTSFLVATLTASIQELKALVDGQAVLIATQASTITALQAEVEALKAQP